MKLSMPINGWLLVVLIVWAAGAPAVLLGLIGMWLEEKRESWFWVFPIFMWLGVTWAMGATITIMQRVIG
jgi:hypothetical protein